MIVLYHSRTLKLLIVSDSIYLLHVEVVGICTSVPLLVGLANVVLAGVDYLLLLLSVRQTCILIRHAIDPMQRVRTHSVYHGAHAYIDLLNVRLFYYLVIFVLAMRLCHHLERRSLFVIITEVVVRHISNFMVYARDVDSFIAI